MLFSANENVDLNLDSDSEPIDDTLYSANEKLLNPYLYRTKYQYPEVERNAFSNDPNQKRDSLIEELLKVQRETLKYFENNRNELKSLRPKDNQDAFEKVFKPRLFNNKSMILWQAHNSSSYMLNLVGLNFHLNSTQQTILK